MNKASVSIWMFWSRSRRSAWRDRRSRRLAIAASRWSAASGDSQDAKAAATMLDLDTPFLAASSSSRLACSGWMKRFKRCWLIARFRRQGRGMPAGTCAAGSDRAGAVREAACRRHRAARGRRQAQPGRGRRRRLRRVRVGDAGHRRQRQRRSLQRLRLQAPPEREEPSARSSRRAVRKARRRSARNEHRGGSTRRWKFASE